MDSSWPRSSSTARSSPSSPPMSPPRSRPSASAPAPPARASRRRFLTRGPAGLRLATSPRNPALQLARALQAKKVRRERRLFVAEGEDLVDAALAAGAPPGRDALGRRPALDDDPRVAATAGLARALPRAAQADGPGERPGRRPARHRDRPSAPAAQLQRRPLPARARRSTWPVSPTPGNVGTLVRTAAALGADWLALGPGSADAFHPRAVRAAMGATFALPLLEGVSPGRPGHARGLRRAGGRAAWRRAALGGRPDPADRARARRRAGRARPRARGPRRRAGDGARDDPAGRGRRVPQRRGGRGRAARRGGAPAGDGPGGRVPSTGR